MSQLGSALRQWRDRLSAVDAGLPVSTTRRAPGLRREELAQLAGISVDYVTRLEQGRVTTPSGQVLESLARVLRLTHEERELAFALARRLPRQDRMRTELTPSVRRLLEHLQTPVCVYDACWTQLAWNRSFAVLLGDPAGWRGLAANLVYRLLVGAPTRVRHDAAEGEEYLNAYVADLRATHARFPRDPRVTKLISALSPASAGFATLWDGHEIAGLHETHKTIDHPQVGVLQLDCDVLRVDGADLRIVLFTAAPETPQADALRLLASLDVTSVGQAADQPAGDKPSDRPLPAPAATTHPSAPDRR